MKHLIVILILFSLNCKAQNVISKLWYSIDTHTRHEYTGFFAVNIGGMYTYKLLKEKSGLTVLARFGTGIAAIYFEEIVWEGFINKEIINFGAIKDMCWGVLVGTLVLSVRINWHQNRQYEKYLALQKKFENLMDTQ